MSKRNRRGLVEKANPNYQTVVMAGPSALPVQMPRNMRAYLQEGYRNKTAFRVVGQIARSGAGIKWKHYYDQTKQREYTSSPLLDVWNRPNSEQGGGKFRENLLGYYCLTGNSYILGINASQNPKAKFDELHCLRPDLTKVHISEALEVDYYEFGPASPYRRYDKPSVLHSKLFAANDDVYGLSPVEVAAMLVDIQKASQKWNLALMSNMAAPSGAWVTKQILNDPDYRNLKKEIHEKFSGPRNAREPVILHGGVEWQSMSMTPMELDFLASDDKTDRDIAGIFFNYPIFLLGLSDTTFNNQAEAKHYLYTDIIFPILDAFVDDLNRWLTPRYGGWLDYDREDVETIQERIQAAKAQLSDRAMGEFAGGTTTFLEAREIQGKQSLSVKDFVMVKDVPVHLEALDEYIAALSDKVTNPPPPPPQLIPQTTVTEEPNGNNSPDAGDSQGESGDSGNKMLALPSPRTKALDLSTTEQKEAYQAYMDTLRDKWVGEFQGRMKVYFQDNRKTVLAALSNAKPTEFDQEDVYTRVDHALHMIEQQGTLKQIIVSLYQAVGTDVGGQVLKELKAGDGPDEHKGLLTDFLNFFGADILAYLLQLAALKVKQISETERAQIQSKLEEGVRGGEGIPDLAKRIDDLYLLQIIPNRSQVIARTEVLAASNYGSQQAAKQSGLTLKKVWLATSDSRTREAHQAADGQEVEMDEPFVVSGAKLMYPGDSSLGAPASQVVDCRCTQYYRRVREPVKSEFPETSVSREAYRALLKAFAGKHGHHDQHTHGRRRSFGTDALAGKSMSEKEHFLAKHGGDKWEEDIPVPEYKAIQDYSLSHYKAMNNHLRGKGGADAAIVARIEHCQQGLLKASAPADIVVKRGYGDSQLPHFLEAAKKGGFYQEKGFASATIMNEPSYAGFSVNIKVFKGAPGAYVAPVSGITHEREWLIPHGAKFKVTSAKKGPDGEWVFDVEYKGTHLKKPKKKVFEDFSMPPSQKGEGSEDDEESGELSDKFVCPADGLDWITDVEEDGEDNETE